jgi:hypothetical protein
MQKCEVEVFSGAVNSVVLRVPGRKFPGLLIQGDTFSTFYAMAKKICDLAKFEGAVELMDLSQQLEDDLGSRLRDYEQVLVTHGIDLPYVSPFATQKNA